MVFVASLTSCWERNEDNTQSGLAESIDVFTVLLNSEELKSSKVVVMLNKVDLFETMVKIRSLKVLRKDGPFWKNAPKGKKGKDFSTAVEYIRSRFLKVAKSKSRSVSVHETTAVDRKNAQRVLDDTMKSFRQNFFQPGTGFGVTTQTG